MNGTMQAEFNRKMKALEDGKLFQALKRSVVDKTRFLIVSYGGTGADALFKVREVFQKYIPEEQLNSHVKFLAIDTDRNTNTHMVPQKQADGTQIMVKDAELSADEFLWLDNSPARSAVTTNPDQFKDWMNPNLPRLIAADPSYLDGNGASGMRQIGRLTLFPAAVTNAMTTKVGNQVRLLTNNNADNLHVMIITGISGGTGSGVVVDSTYLIRDIISKLPGGVGDRTKYMGFILLPPTGDSNDVTKIEHGNSNGYAAMKEINQFMTTSARDDQYVQRFATGIVRSGKSIFDNCYLLDGVQNDVALSNPRKVAKTVLAECLLDMATSQPTTQGAAPQTVDSFMSDVSTFANIMINGKSHLEAPRDADYVYNVIGHGTVSVPVDLMKSYVVQKVFERMHKSFENCSNVTPNDVRDFVRNVRVSPFSDSTQRRKIDEALDSLFRDPMRGPFYVINLLKDAAGEANAQQHKMFVGAEAKRQYEFMERYFLKQNNEVFSVFTAVLEELKRLMRKEGNAVIAGGHDYANHTYTFEPITLGTIDGKATIVTQYLDKLITPSRVKNLTQKMLDTMIANKKEWTQLIAKDGATGSFDAPAQIRNFWTKEIGEIVKATVEDLLIKVYTDNPDAHYDANDPSTTSALEQAAGEIFQRMYGAAGTANPMAELDINTGLTMDAFNGHNLVLVPKEAPNLLRAMRTYAQQNPGLNVDVFESEADDRISCYTQYTAVPAFKFKWVQRAEPVYEATLSTTGLHMSETAGGKQWRNFSNLMPESSWRAGTMYQYNNAREKSLADQAQELFSKAIRLGLTVGTPAAVGHGYQYAVKTLPEAYQISADMFRDFDVQNVPNGDQRRKAQAEEALNQKADEIAQTLFKQIPNWLGIASDSIPDALAADQANPVVFQDHKLWQANSVLTTPDTVDGWREYVAACFLRKMPEVVLQLRSTVMIMEKLKALVEMEQLAQSAIIDFAHYLTAELFEYDDQVEYAWIYRAGRSTKILFEPEYHNKIHENAAYFFMFNQFKQQAAQIHGDLQPDYDEKSGNVRDIMKAERIKKMDAMREAAQALHAKNAEKLESARKSQNPDRLSVFDSPEFRLKAKTEGYDADAIREFYYQLNQTLEREYHLD